MERWRLFPEKPIPHGSINELIHQRKINNEMAAREQQTEGRKFTIKAWKHTWGRIESSLENYGKTFNSILGGKLLKEFIEKKEKDTPRYILDLMADETAVGEAVSDCNFDGGVAVTLGYKRKLPKEGIGASVDLINGDLLSKKTWGKIEQWLADRKGQFFDVILSRPQGGADHLTNNPHIHYYLLQRVWSLLNPDGGVALLQVPIAARNLFEKYVELLKESGISIEADLSRSVLWYDNAYPVKIVRDPQSPDVLPKFSSERLEQVKNEIKRPHYPKLFIRI